MNGALAAGTNNERLALLPTQHPIDRYLSVSVTHYQLIARLPILHEYANVAFLGIVIN